MSSTIKQAIQALKSRVADAFAAVEAKGGTLPATQDTANLPAAIASIPSGGGVVEKEEKDVLFIDYDGTIIASYTYEEFESVTDYPTPPEHEGLTFVGWTNTIQELKDNPKKITLSGAMYTTTDEYVHIFIETFAPNQTFVFRMYAQQAFVGVDWGDGESTTTQANSYSHTFANAGKYEIKYKSGRYAELFIEELVSKQFVKEVWFKSNIYPNKACVGQAGLASCKNLQAVVFPKDVIAFAGNDNINGCVNLGALVINLIGGQHRSEQYSGCKYQTKRQNYGSAPDNNQYRLRRMNFDDDGINRFDNDGCLQYIWQNPNAAVGTMTGCNSAREIHLPYSSVPSLANTNYFTSVPTTCKIYVKTGLKSSYASATNWSTIYAQYEFIEED